VKVSDLVARLVLASAGGSGMFSAAPGCSTLANRQPSSREMMAAVTNHRMALPPTRPTALLSPMLAMPETTVLKTSGAMIILIRRRKMSLTRLK